MALPFGTWPSEPYAVAPLPSVADAITHLYVRTQVNGGSDVGGDGSVPRPFATPQRAASELQRYNGRPTVVHMGSGVYERPVLVGLRGPFVFVGDGGGASLDDGLAQELGPTAAAAGTGGQAIAGTFVPDALDGFAVEMLDGAAAGQRRTIIETTLTELIPASNFAPVPAPGDLFRVVSPNIFWEETRDEAIFAQGCGSPLAFGTTGVPPTQLGDVVRAGFFVNILYRSSAGNRNLRAYDSCLFWYGFDEQANILSHQQRRGFGGMGGESTGSQAAGHVAAMLGLAAETTYRGYTLVHRGVNPQGLYISEGQIIGRPYSLGGLAADLGAEISMTGGRVLATGSAHAAAAFSNGSISGATFQSPYLRLEAAGTGRACYAFQGGRAFIFGAELIADSGDALKVSEGGTAVAGGLSPVTSASGNAANASQGGRLYLEGSPAATWAGGSADFRVSDLETATAATFSAVDVTLVAAVGNGSIITRTS